MMYIYQVKCKTDIKCYISKDKAEVILNIKNKSFTILHPKSTNIYYKYTIPVLKSY